MKPARSPSVADSVPRAKAPRKSSTHRRRDTLTFLAELSEALTGSLDLKATLAQAVHRVADFMQVEAALLFLRTDDGAALECRICVGPVDITGTRLAPGQGAIGRAVVDNAIQIVADASTDKRTWRDAARQRGFVVRSLVCAPLRTASGPIGALEIINRRDGKPFTAADAELLGIVAAPAALAIHSARMAVDQLEQQRLKREFGLARRLQKSLLPKRRRDGFPVLGVNRPAHEISGDFFDHFELDDGRIGFVVGDVSGKGLDAALLMVRAASLLRWIGKDGLAPSAWLARANDELSATTQDGRFVCALVGYCDRAGEHIVFAGAGFPPVLVRKGGVFSEHESGGPPLAIVAGMRYDEHAIELDGGTFYAFSDGATDVRDAHGQRIGSAGVRALIERHADAAPDARVRGLLAELRRLHLVDDTTLLLIEAPRSHDVEVVLERHLPALAGQLRDVRSALRRALDALDIATRWRDRLVLAVDEACTNIIRHGYGADCDGHIDLRVSVHDGMLVFELSDVAPCVDPARIKPQPLGECRNGGLGVALIDAVMDEWRVEPGRGAVGNRLVMRKRIEPMQIESGQIESGQIELGRIESMQIEGNER